MTTNLDEGNFAISIEDEGGGEFVMVREMGDEERKILIDPRDWPELRKEISTMINNCKG